MKDMIYNIVTQKSTVAITSCALGINEANIR